VNPSLTAIADALRVGDHLLETTGLSESAVTAAPLRIRTGPGRAGAA
jgi:hypothetical protein